MLKSISPVTGALIQSYSEMSREQIQTVIQKTHRAHLIWRHTTFSERIKRLKKLSDLLRQEIETHARLVTLEMGKPIKEARAEIEKCAWVCDYYAENAERFLADLPIKTDAGKSFVSYQPLGVVLAIMPWNFPYWQVLRFAAPTLTAGNGVLLKHAPNVTGCALAIETLFLQAGFPENVFTTLRADVDHVSGMIENPLVRAVTLTGSTRAGSAVAQKAGEMLKKTVLELGGSDPYIILEDADLEAAATACVTSRLINSGQSCVAAKRFIVPESIAERFEGLMVEKMRAMQTGDPMLEETQIGPLARTDLRDNLHRQVTKSISAGATCLLGGKIPPGDGAFYPPTVLGNVQQGMPAYHEELFGPVASIITVKDESEAILVANSSAYGLGAAIFTGDAAKGERIAKYELEAGNCFVNDFVKSDPRLPFGGVKQSGIGRELSHFGIHEFVNIKTVYRK